LRYTTRGWDRDGDRVPVRSRGGWDGVARGLVVQYRSLNS
jgi:hypothetical protein